MPRHRRGFEAASMAPASPHNSLLLHSFQKPPAYGLVAASLPVQLSCHSHQQTRSDNECWPGLFHATCMHSPSWPNAVTQPYTVVVRSSSTAVPSPQVYCPNAVIILCAFCESNTRWASARRALGRGRVCGSRCTKCSYPQTPIESHVRSSPRALTMSTRRGHTAPRPRASLAFGQ